MSPQRTQAAGPRDESRDGLVDAHTVLVARPNAGSAGELVGALQASGMPAHLATRPQEIFFWVKEAPPAIVVADLALRGGSILVGELRRQGRQVVALSDDTREREAALAMGCLQALHGSDPTTEIALHIRALMRRRDVRRLGHIAAGPIEVDLSRSCIRVNSQALALSPRLLDLVAHLAVRSGGYVSARVLLEEVWGEPWGDVAKVHLAVLRLRQALMRAGASSIIVTQRGFGYGLYPTVNSTRVSHHS